MNTEKESAAEWARLVNETAERLVPLYKTATPAVQTVFMHATLALMTEYNVPRDMQRAWIGAWVKAEGNMRTESYANGYAKGKELSA